MKQCVIGLIVAMFMTVGSVMAASIPVTNPGFESAGLGAGGFLEMGTGGAHGWYEENTVWPKAYYKNVLASEFTSVPAGTHIVQLDCRPANGIGYIEQPNIVAIDEAKVYTLQVYVGCNVGGVFPPEYYVALMKGTAVAARYSSTIAVTADSWVEITVTYTPMPGDGGKMLGIRLGNRLDLVDASLYFDDVRLSDADRVDFDTIKGVNWGFENPEQTDAAYVTLATSGGTYTWFEENGTGWPAATINNTSTEFSSVPEGVNVARLDTRTAVGFNSIMQTNLFPIDETKTYTLQVQVGQQTGATFPPDYYVALLKGSDPAAKYMSTIAPGADSWDNITVTYSPFPGDEGKMLGLQLGNLAGDAAATSVLYFDDVRLGQGARVAPGTISVLNWSFENPKLPDGASRTLAHDDTGPYAWYDADGPDFGGVYIYNVSAAAFPSGVPHGSNAVQLDTRDAGTKTTVIQEDILVIEEGTIYSLSAKVGKSATQAFPQDYFVRLLKDGDTAAEVASTTAPASDSWVEVTVRYLAVPGDGGKMLGIEMGNQVGGATGAYMWFDDVRLSFPQKGTLLTLR